MFLKIDLGHAESFFIFYFIIDFACCFVVF